MTKSSSCMITPLLNSMMGESYMHFTTVNYSHSQISCTVTNVCMGVAYCLTTESSDQMGLNYKEYYTSEPLLKGKVQYNWTPHLDGFFCKKRKYSFSTNSSRSEIVSIRRSTVLIIPLQ